MKQNITISLDKALIQKARVLAARRGLSVSKLLAAELAEIVKKEERYEQSRRQALAMLEEGLHLGGGPPVARDELHER
jgi:hypothetical protein